jgi:hypothetical protein
MEVDDFFDAAHIVPKPIHECPVAVEQGSESLHIVSVPGGLECVGAILRSFHLSHVDSRKIRSLSVILCARHNRRQGAYYAEQSEESGS